MEKTNVALFVVPLETLLPTLALGYRRPRGAPRSIGEVVFDAFADIAVLNKAPIKEYRNHKFHLPWVLDWQSEPEDMVTIDIRDANQTMVINWQCPRFCTKANLYRPPGVGPLPMDHNLAPRMMIGLTDDIFGWLAAATYCGYFLMTPAFCTAGEWKSQEDHCLLVRNWDIHTDRPKHWLAMEMVRRGTAAVLQQIEATERARRT